MKNFNNETYSILVTDLLNDAFYTEGRSIRGQIATIRQYAEIFVRKILDLDKDMKITLGNREIKVKLEEKSGNNILLIEALETIKDYGNNYTHTQCIDTNPTQEDLDIVIESLFNLYAYLFIDYFKKYKFGTSNDIMRTFSLLPPIIRYKALDYLYKLDLENVYIIDKLFLAILKAFDKETCLIWLNNKKEKLINISSAPEAARLDMIKNYGELLSSKIIEAAPNMYELCLMKADEVSNFPPLYHDFESAIPFYQENGKMECNSIENEEFNSLMEFVYMGRKERVKLINQTS